MCQGMSFVSVHAHLCALQRVVTPWDLLGQFLEIGISLLTARCGQPLAMPKTLQNDLDSCSKALGEDSPMSLALLATLAKEPGLESGTFGCSLRHFLLLSPSDAHCVLQIGWGVAVGGVI